MKGRDGKRRTIRGAIAGSGLAFTALIALATTTFACSAVMGNLLMTPSSGAARTVITTSASGLKAYPAQYAVHFANDSSTDCMDFTNVTTIKTLRTNAKGQWNNKTMTIPASATQGSHEICGVELSPLKGESATIHMTFTVV